MGHRPKHSRRWKPCQTSQGRHPRDPAVPAANEPTARLRLPAEFVRPDFRSNAVGSEAVEPEVLTPEQAAARRHAKSSVEVQAGVDENLIEGANAPHNPGADDGLAQPNPVDAQAVVEIADAPIWRKFALGTSLQLLRSTRPGVVRRALRKLHIRWYHAPSRRMATLLTAAGVSSDIVALVPDIVSTCEICRAWSRPGPRSMTSTR